MNGFRKYFYAPELPMAAKIPVKAIPAAPWWSNPETAGTIWPELSVGVSVVATGIDPEFIPGFQSSKIGLPVIPSIIPDPLKKA